LTSAGGRLLSGGIDKASTTAPAHTQSNRKNRNVKEILFRNEQNIKRNILVPHLSDDASFGFRPNGNRNGVWILKEIMTILNITLLVLNTMVYELSSIRQSVKSIIIRHGQNIYLKPTKYLLKYLLKSAKILT